MKRVIFSIFAAGLLITNVCNGASLMTMTTNSNELKIFIAGSGSISIDWGDGTPVETHTLFEYNENDWNIVYSVPLNGDLSVYKGRTYAYYHCYSDISSHKIVITDGNITHLACEDIQLTCLDVSGNVALSELLCAANELSSLDVSKNTVLKKLDCSRNQLTCLDVSKNTELDYLYCGFNQISLLDVTGNTKLKVLFCSNSLLTGLDLSKNIALTGLSCCFNQINTDGLNNLFKTLHSNKGKKEIMVSVIPGKVSYDRKIAKKKGWKIITNYDNNPWT